jgi:hypothetical protein
MHTSLSENKLCELIVEKLEYAVAIVSVLPMSFENVLRFLNLFLHATMNS